MAKIAFINPAQDAESIYGSLSAERSTLPPLGLCYLAGVMQAGGHDVKIIDAPALGITNEETVSSVLEWGARYAGITSTTDTVFSAAKAAGLIKAKDKGVVTLLGGAHVTAMPEDTLRKFGSFDYGVIGEGETTLKELIDALEKDRHVGGIKGIVYRDGGNVILKDGRPFIEDLDSLPFPAWKMLPDISRFYRPFIGNYKRLPSASLVTSRGCPGRCAFCDTKVFGSKYRVHSAEYVLKMIRYLKENHGIKDICFYDDVFTVFKKRLSDICEGLRKKDCSVAWSCMARVNTVDYEMMKMMKDAGCWKIGFGIESASDNILKLMNKNATTKQAKKAVAEAKKAGLEVEGYFILGFFGENRETLKETRDFIVKSELDMVLLSHFLPFPGSPAYAHLGKYGDFREDWENMNAVDSDKPQFIPFGLKSEDLITAQKNIYRDFYFRPRIFMTYLAKMLREPANAVKLMRASVNFSRFLFKNKAA